MLTKPFEERVNPAVELLQEMSFDANKVQDPVNSIYHTSRRKQEQRAPPHRPGHALRVANTPSLDIRVVLRCSTADSALMVQDLRRLTEVETDSKVTSPSWE